METPEPDQPEGLPVECEQQVPTEVQFFHLREEEEGIP
jgi:hypothetical protein